MPRRWAAATGGGVELPVRGDVRSFSGIGSEVEEKLVAGLGEELPPFDGTSTHDLTPFDGGIVPVLHQESGALGLKLGRVEDEGSVAPVPDFVVMEMGARQRSPGLALPVQGDLQAHSPSEVSVARGEFNLVEGQVAAVDEKAGHSLGGGARFEDGEIDLATKGRVLVAGRRRAAEVEGVLGEVERLRLGPFAQLLMEILGDPQQGHFDELVPAPTHETMLRAPS